MSELRVVSEQPSLGITAALADWVAALSHAAIDADARRVARHCLLDWVAVTAAGAQEEGSIIVREVALEQGGAPQASLIGTALQTSVVNAALVNGAAAHALDFDDVHLGLTGHPTVTVMSALLPLAEREGASSAELICAFVAGVEVACRIGRYVGPAHYARGWHATATIGAIAAAAGCARLLGLDGAATARAMGLAASQAGGLKSMFGTMCKPLHAGKAASNGLYAALLAQRGFTAREDILECEQGFNATFGGAADEHTAMAELGAHFEVRDVLFKYHAACYGTHASIDAVASLREAGHFEPEQIERIDLTVPEPNMGICNIQEPSTGLEAKFSMRLTAAMAAAGVATGDVAVYDGALCQRPELVRLRDRVHVSADPGAFHAGATAVVHLADGVAHRAQADLSVAEPDLDRQERRLQEKFTALVAPVFGGARTAALAAVVLGVDGEGAVADLAAACRT